MDIRRYTKTSTSWPTMDEVAHVDKNRSPSLAHANTLDCVDRSSTISIIRFENDFRVPLHQHR